MPSPPLPFDDDEIDPADDSGQPHERPPSRRSHRPNFWVRRVVVVGGIVAVFAAAALVVGQLMSTTSTDVTSGAISTEWDNVVVIDPRTGRIQVDDSSGDEVGSVDTGLRAVAAQRVVAGTALVADADAAVVVDLDAEQTTDIDLAGGAITQPSGSALTMVLATSDRGVLVHGPSGDIVDTDSLAPIPGTRYEWADARSDPSGRHVLVTDSGNFQSVLFSFEREDPAYVRGLALAVDGSFVVTTQNVGAEATINVFDHDGESVSSATASSVRAAMISGDSIHLVTVDGEIVTMATGNGDTSSTGQLEIGLIETGVVTTNGDRLVLTGAEGTAIIDTDGDVVGTYPGQRIITASWAADGSSCVTLTGDGAVATIVELADGSVENETEVTDPVFSTADGCTIASATADGYQLASPESVAAVTTTGTLVGLAPDGDRVVLQLDRRTVLAPIGGDDDETVDLGPVGREVAFT